ncbi:MAG: hypothetical protein ABFC31_00905 [Clostridiaceae bacterium]
MDKLLILQEQNGVEWGKNSENGAKCAGYPARGFGRKIFFVSGIYELFLARLRE